MRTYEKFETLLAGIFELGLCCQRRQSCGRAHAGHTRGTRGASALCRMFCCSLGQGNDSKFASHGFGDFPASPSFTLSLFSLAFGCVFVFVSLSLLSTCRITFSRQETVEPLLRLSFKIVTAKETPVPQKAARAATARVRHEV